MESVANNSPLPKRLGLTPRPYARYPLPKIDEPDAPDTEKPREDRLAAAAPDSSTDPREKEWANLVATLLLHRRRLLRLPGVTAVDVGYKIKESQNNRFLDELALRVHVERKLHPDELKNRS